MPNPDAIAGLYNWYRADAITGVANGAAVASWPDSGSGGFTLTNGNSTKPTYVASSLIGSKPAIACYQGGTLGALASSTASGGQSTQTLTVVIRVTAFSASFIAGANSQGLSLYLNSAGRVQVVKSGSAVIMTSATVLSLNTNYVITADFTNAGAVNLYINGTKDTNSTTTTQTVAGGSGALFLIGGSNLVSAEPFRGFIAEVIHYSVVLGQASRASVHSYVQDKYGITVSDYTAGAPAAPTNLTAVASRDGLPAAAGAWALNAGNGLTAVDSSGNGRTLTAGSSGFTWTTGKNGRGVAGNLGGAASGLGSTAFSNPTGNLTILGWVRPGSLLGEKAAFGFVTDVFANFSSQYILWTSRSGFGTMDRLVGNFRLNGSLQEIVGPMLNLGQWYHVAMTYDGANVRLYIDGTQYAVVAATGTLGVGNMTLVPNSDASVDDVRYFTTALTQAQIQTAMNNPADGFNAPVTPSTQITLNWSAVPGVTQYKVFRRDVVIATVSTNTFTETGLPGLTRYDYYVKSVGTGGQTDSDASNTAGALTPAAFRPGAPKVIFDTDMSADIDDLGSVMLLHALMDLGECEIIGMAVSSTNGGAALGLDAVNTWYGRSYIPIGVRSDVGGAGGYPATIANEYPHPITNIASFPNASTLMRQLFASSPDASVVVITVGYLNNLSAALNSAADSVSSLTGTQLITQKVRLWSCMGGVWPSGSEYNFKSSGDGGAGAFNLVNNWPTAVNYAGYEIGGPIYTGGRFETETPAGNIGRRGWQVFAAGNAGVALSSSDQIATLLAVRPDEGLFGKVTTGRGTATSTGDNAWVASPDPSGAQEQAYFTERQRWDTQQAIDALQMAQAAAQAPYAPAQPTNLQGTPAGGQMVLTWTRNSWSETGFTIQRRDAGVWATIGTVGAGVTTFTDTNPGTVTNRAYRVRADNALGSSVWTPVTIYGTWLQINTTTPANVPVYDLFHTNDLRYSRMAAEDHLAILQDVTTGQNLTIDVDVTSRGDPGSVVIYFLYQDASNWYRLRSSNTTTVFEKSVAGTVTQIGSAGGGTNIQKSPHFTVTVTPSSLSFTGAGVTVTTPETLSFTSGKTGVGGLARGPIWSNYSVQGDSASTAPTDVQVSDLAAGSDAAGTTVQYVRELSDTAAGADTLTAVNLRMAVLADTAAGSDVLDASRTVVNTVSIGSTATGADAVTSSTGFDRSATDSASGADAVSAATTAPRAADDAATGADGLDVRFTATRDLADAAAGTDALTVTASGAILTALTDAASGSDGLTVVIASELTVSDSAAGADTLTVTTSGTVVANVADAAGGTDTLTATISRTVTVTDAAGGSDSVTVVVAVSIALFDSSPGTDQLSITAMVTRTVADVAVGTDVLIVVVGDAAPFPVIRRLRGPAPRTLRGPGPRGLAGPRL